MTSGVRSRRLGGVQLFVDGLALHATWDAGTCTELRLLSCDADKVRLAHAMYATRTWFKTAPLLDRVQSFQPVLVQHVLAQVVSATCRRPAFNYAYAAVRAQALISRVRRLLLPGCSYAIAHLCSLASQHRDPPRPRIWSRFCSR